MGGMAECPALWEARLGWVCLDEVTTPPIGGGQRLALSSTIQILLLMAILFDSTPSFYDTTPIFPSYTWMGAGRRCITTSPRAGRTLRPRCFEGGAPA